MFANMFTQPTYFGDSPFYSQGRRKQQQDQQPRFARNNFFGDFEDVYADPWEQEALRRKRQAQQNEALRRKKLAQQESQRKALRLKQEAEHRQALQEQKEREEYMRQLNMARTRRGQWRPPYAYVPDSRSGTEDEEVEDTSSVKTQPRTIPVAEEDKTACTSTSSESSSSEDEYDTASEPEEEEEAVPAPKPTIAAHSQPATATATAEPLAAKLHEFQAKLENSIATYTRIKNASSSSSGSSSDEESRNTYNSRVKVLQRTQIEIEKLYEQLDSLEAPKSEELRRLKHKLTGRAVNFADKVDELRNELKDRMSALDQRLRKVTLEDAEDESE